MSNQSVGAHAQSFGLRPYMLAGLRIACRRLRRLWSAARAGHSIAEIDARLLRDIGLSEFAADKAVTAMLSQGLSEGFSVAGLGSCNELLSWRGRSLDRGQVRIVCISERDAS